MLASGSADQTVKLWDLGTSKCISTFKQNQKVSVLEWKGKDTLLIAGLDSKAQIFNVNDMSKLET